MMMQTTLCFGGLNPDGSLATTRAEKEILDTGPPRLL